MCVERNVTLLCYGALLGGFLSDRWLGQREPDPRSFVSISDEKVNTVFLLCLRRRLTNLCDVVQYFEILRVWGSWEQYQELLLELKAVARKHKSTIAHVGLR
jgi:aryl-alcohol dehydrogenase-like predicted oxidoreductase